MHDYFPFYPLFFYIGLATLLHLMLPGVRQFSPFNCQACAVVLCIAFCVQKCRIMLFSTSMYCRGHVVGLMKIKSTNQLNIEVSIFCFQHVNRNSVVVAQYYPSNSFLSFFIETMLLATSSEICHGSI